MFYYILLTIYAFLPFQFALNPKEGIDLASIRIIVPMFFLAYLYSCIKNKEPFILKDRLTSLLFIFLVFATFSLFFSHNLSWSMRKILFLFSIAPIYLITLAIINTSKKARRAIIILVYGGFILSIVGIFQFLSQFIFGLENTYAFLAKYSTPFFLGNSFSQTVLTYPSWLVNSNGNTYMRAFGIFPDPHMFSFYMELLLPWSITLWATEKKHHFLFLISSICLAIANILSFTRGGYIAIILAAIATIPMVSKKTARKIILGILIFAIFFMVAPNSPVSQRLSSSFDKNEGSNKARLGNWNQAILIIKNNPLGVGIGSYSLTVDQNSTYREPTYAHNLYLDIAAELGIITLFIFILILISALLNFYSLAKIDSFWIAGISSIIIFLVHCFVESPLYSVHILSLILIIFAISNHRNSNEQNS